MQQGETFRYLSGKRTQSGTSVLSSICRREHSQQPSAAERQRRLDPAAAAGGRKLGGCSATPPATAAAAAAAATATSLAAGAKVLRLLPRPRRRHTDHELPRRFGGGRGGRPGPPLQRHRGL